MAAVKLKWDPRGEKRKHELNNLVLPLRLLRWAGGGSAKND